MRTKSKKPIVAATLFVAAALTVVSLAQVQLATCYQTVVKGCCTVAGATMSTECTAGNYTWQCVANVTANPFVNTTTTSTVGNKFKLNQGTANCDYEPATCGTSVGSCGTGNPVTESCTSHVASGALCVGRVVPVGF